MHSAVVQLLEKVSFNQDSDYLVLAGDMIFKGPDSNGVIELLKSLGGTCVRGNHEDRTILAYASMHSSLIPLPGPDEDPARTEDDLSEESFSHGDYKHRNLAKELGYDQIKYLQQCPVILHVGKIAGQDYVIVHAGLTPGVSLEKQDPFQVMNMRSIDLQSRVPSEGRMGEPWEKVSPLTNLITDQHN
jgi:Calcineurin-like phosphoesterase